MGLDGIFEGSSGDVGALDRTLTGSGRGFGNVRGSLYRRRRVGRLILWAKIVL